MSLDFLLMGGEDAAATVLVFQFGSTNAADAGINKFTSSAIQTLSSLIDINGNSIAGDCQKIATTNALDAGGSGGAGGTTATLENNKLNLGLHFDSSASFIDFVTLDLGAPFANATGTMRAVSSILTPWHGGLKIGAEQHDFVASSAPQYLDFSFTANGSGVVVVQHRHITSATNISGIQFTFS